jgi:hypothetical protein
MSDTAACPRCSYHNWTLLEEAEGHLAAVRKAKEKLRPIALKDLGVN